jgi:hypothetical protein
MLLLEQIDDALYQDSLTLSKQKDIQHFFAPIQSKKRLQSQFQEEKAEIIEVSDDNSSENDTE